jgi:hypothetical protein
MKGQFGSAALLFVVVQTVFAQEEAPSQQKIEFECGGATVVIDSEPKGFRSPEEAFVKTGKLVQAHIVVTRADSRATFQSWRDIDYIGGTCMQDARGQPRIVYNASCGGSGCTGQWGIIDPAALRELLVPSENNTERARQLLGLQPKDAPKRLSLLLGK